MAGIKDSMRNFVADSMGTRPAIGGQSPPPADAPKSSVQRQTEGRKRLDGGAYIELSRIVPDPNQPRTEFDESDLQDFAALVREKGVQTPIRVRWDDAVDRYVIIFGERRFRAATLAGLESIPVVVAAGDASPEDILEDQLMENIMRSQLRPIEKARSYKRLLDGRGISQRQLAERLHISQTSISEALTLLELPAPIQAKVDAGLIAPQTAKQLVKVADPEMQAEAAERAERRDGRDPALRRDDAREMVAKAKQQSRGGKAPKASAPPKPRTFKVAGGKLTVELKRDGSPDAVVAALVEALKQATGREYVPMEGGEVAEGELAA